MKTSKPLPGARAFALASLAALSLAGAAARASAQTPSASPAPTPTPAGARALDAPQQTRPAAKADAKAEEVLRRAVEAMGGPAYLAVNSVVSRGNYTPYADGAATLPVKFTDYLVFPDRERVEFKGSALRSVETYTRDGGWIYDGAKLTLKDATPDQMRGFRTALRTSLDNALRGWWRAEGAELAYVGRREAGLARRNEVVRITYPDGFSVEFEFGARDGLPSKVVYRKAGAGGEEAEEEDRYAQFLSVGGVTVPFVVDHFRAGTQSSRVNYEAIEFNRPVPDALFAKPADARSFKY
ncbi:MAG TPA: hypothetical protein VER32_00200 [Pyrinomonadaceae bacterium]|nr:hypothetical protein [Pyrinomonadaceae bacterium]